MIKHIPWSRGKLTGWLGGEAACEFKRRVQSHMPLTITPRYIGRVKYTQQINRLSIAILVSLPNKQLVILWCQPLLSVLSSLQFILSAAAFTCHNGSCVVRVK